MPKPAEIIAKSLFEQLDSDEELEFLESWLPYVTKALEKLHTAGFVIILTATDPSDA